MGLPGTEESMLYRFMAIPEIIVSIYLIFRIGTHTDTPRDFLAFALVTMLFSMAIAKGNRARRERHGEESREKARRNFDRKRYEEMRREVEEMDETEYETHPINVQEFAGRLYRGEASLSDIPDTRSRAAREHSEGKE